MALAASGCTSGEDEAAAPSPTARAERGSVTASVTATGSLQFIDRLKLNFGVSGRIAELNVARGDQVRPGQVLARVEDTEQQLTVRTAQDQVRRAEAALGRVVDGNQTETARDEVGQARKALEAARRQATETQGLNDSTVRQAEVDLQGSIREFERLKDRLPAARAADNKCENSLENDLNTAHTDCDEVENLQDEIAAARRDVQADQAALDVARRQRDLARAGQQAAVVAAKGSLEDAQNASELAKTDRGYIITDQRAALDQARAEVDRAQKALDDTILRTPVAGRVAAVNGNVGEFVPAPSGTTVLALGPGDTPERPSPSDAFVVVEDINTFQVRVPFNEADAVRMKPGQEVELSFDTVPGLTRKGTVTAIEPVQSTTGGATTFIATVVLNELDPRLQDGMTTQVRIIVARVDNVLVIPRSAVRGGAGGRPSVSVVQPDGTQREVPVELGLLGDTLAEVRSGLREGDLVAVPRGR